jgi:putrescine---pyruvate transaminase
MTREAASRFWHSYADMKSVTETGELVITRGKGSYVFDEDGRRYLDMSGRLRLADDERLRVAVAVRPPIATS